MTAALAQHPSRSVLGEIRSIAVERPLLPALCVIAFATVLRAMSGVDTDVAWQLWVAHRVNLGARLYRDIVEVNPPLWFWLAVPVDGLAAMLQIRSDAVLIVAIGLSASASIKACASLLARVDPARRSVILTYFALMLTVMPWAQAGQREHLALIGALP